MPDVLIFEDDPSVGDMASEVLRFKGLTVGHYLSGAGVIGLVQEGRPKLVMLDIMMPGLDGLSACRAIRSNPATRHVKILILTAKDARQDREAAARYGADIFLNKPFDAAIFARSVGKLLGFPDEPDLKSIPKPPAPPISITMFPGGAAIETASLWILLDAGKGLREWVAAQKRAPAGCWMLLSRYQDGAIAEINAGGTLLAAGCRVKVAGPDDPEAQLQRLAPRMTARAISPSATPLLYPQREGEFQLEPGVVVSTRYCQHPGLTLAFRIDLHGRNVVFCPAHEVNPDASAWKGHEMSKFRGLFSGADLLLHGYRRSLSDPRPDDGLGRGAWEPVVDLACETGVKQLVLFPLPGAFEVKDLQARAESRIAQRKSPLACTAAHSLQRFVL